MASLFAAGLASIILVGASAVVLTADLSQPVATTTRTESAGRSAPPPSQHGQALFAAKGCNGCHALGATLPSVPAGPDLTGLPAVAAARKPGLSAEDYVRESLTDPQAFVVPGFGRSPGEQMPRLPLSESEVDALVAFLLAPRAAR